MLFLMTILRTAIVRAAPTCTLWIYDGQSQCYRFRFWPSIVITMQEYFETCWAWDGSSNLIYTFSGVDIGEEGGDRTWIGVMQDGSFAYSEELSKLNEESNKIDRGVW